MTDVLEESIKVGIDSQSLDSRVFVKTTLVSWVFVNTTLVFEETFSLGGRTVSCGEAGKEKR